MQSRCSLEQVAHTGRSSGHFLRRFRQVKHPDLTRRRVGGRQLRLGSCPSMVALLNRMMEDLVEFEFEMEESDRGNQ